MMIPHDLRMAFRSLRRSPGFAVVAIATLGLGIGAATAIFTVLDQAVLRPLVYDEAERLVYIDSHTPASGEDGDWGLSEAGYFYLREHNRTFDELGAYGGAEGGHEFTVVGRGGGERVGGAWVTASLLEVLGARPEIGRLIEEEDDRPGLPTVALLGHGYWLREYGGDPDVLGTTLELEGGWGVEVIGVLSPGFHLPHSEVDVWLPLGLSPSRPPAAIHGNRVIGRLAPGSTAEEAAQDLAFLTGQFPEALPEAYSDAFMEEAGFTTRVTPLQARVLAGLDRMLWLLFGSVALVVVIACANVANLLLVRAESRRRDRAIRLALGSSRIGLVRQSTFESLLLTLAAAGFGVWVANGALRLLLAVSPPGLTRLSEVSVSVSSVGVAVAIALGTGLLFGGLPLLRGFSEVSALRDGSAGMTPSASRHRIRASMVVAQMALALVLLSSASLMLRSFESLRAVDPGFDPEHVLMVDTHPPGMHERYQEPGTERIQQFYEEVMARVAALPGVEDVGVGGVPLTYEPVCQDLHLEDGPLAAGPRPLCVDQSRVAPGFFRTLGIPLQGREPGWPDGERGADGWEGGEVVVTRALADRLWPGENPIGKGVRLRESGPPYARVVGVTAGQLHWDGLDRPPTEHVFGQLWGRTNTLVVKTLPGHEAGIATAVRTIVRDVDPMVAIGAVQTAEEAIARSPAVARTSFTLLLLGIGAMMGLVLSAVGMSGVFAYLVAQRRAEIGIRIALGARGGEVASMVVRQSLKLATVGVAVGLLGALLASRLLEPLLFRVSPTDPVTLGAVGLILFVVAGGASWIPARRASRVDPMTALRSP